MVAVRWEEAATAAADGSRFDESARNLPSGIDWGMWVGELFFGVEPMKSRLVENLRDNPPVFASESCDTVCAIESSWLFGSFGLEPTG